MGIFTLCLISAFALIGVLKIGNPPGGSPALWYAEGVLLDLAFVKSLTYQQLWLLLYPIKIAGDAGLILIPGYIAKKKFGATNSDLWLWTKVYCYTLTVIDLFWLLALTPATFLGTSGRPILITNFITYMVCGANIVIFTNAYRCCFRLTFDQALWGWFISSVAIPVLLIATLLFFVP
ncbi:MAG: hypothetical protein U0T83_02940 [Bacteriovoracaceae bacterium]